MISSGSFVTAGGIRITRETEAVAFATALDETIVALDQRRGVVLSSAYEYPGRYKRWSMGFTDPPLAVECRGAGFTVTALNERGLTLLPVIGEQLAAHAHLMGVERHAPHITGRARAHDGAFDEQARSRQPSVFSAIRLLQALFAAPEDPHLGLYGAFGYDLIYQFEPIDTMRPRPQDQRDLVLFLPDAVTIVDHERSQATLYRYEFQSDLFSTHGLPRTGECFTPGRAQPGCNGTQDYEVGGYAELVRATFPSFHKGDLFEVVPGQSFIQPTAALPSVIFRTLARINPSPYGFFLNLGAADRAGPPEYLIGASPEMFVRVSQGRVETCPISGTIARGVDAIEDAERVRTLLNSAKDEAELTMCTDVDRNDKARVCIPGSIRVIGRRQIEMYSHLIHTVDHVEGLLRPGMDALDAFLSHMWAVTVTGAPKRAAIAYIERFERSARRWYGGAVGMIGFNGAINTGLTLRTIRLTEGLAEVRVGATLLHDSVPEEEERETHVKGRALFQALKEAETNPGGASEAHPHRPAQTAGGMRVLMVDCEDSFVHTLASYCAATGAEIAIHRHQSALALIERERWDLVVLSPGPGRPAQFALAPMVHACRDRQVPLFGVCLGLQAIGEAFGARLEVMPTPCHGKSSIIHTTAKTRLFGGLPQSFTVGRYHSLRLVPDSVPPELEITARTPDGTIMAIEHHTLAIAAVQFHPESIMTAAGDLGMRVIENAIANLTRKA